MEDVPQIEYILLLIFGSVGSNLESVHSLIASHKSSPTWYICDFRRNAPLDREGR